ncbi:uncharacterized protein NEPG_01540 [Nematocida parisii ERTm1]|uniref:uncharacterized protein n=1 Tax=Nematocida parisii (strain ERTm1 / ATCC PRA-289) TaxID=881290 RepID=UPI000264B9EE|nr:uncharacterized protein NEPG_01540 [Nematocida parisii ERTm1]EIJ93968.1 hypothetical protein NEPG_01540 [Nematocida parisii ERTm1]|eukprot:XP_013059368.1 hypothetical protein NEPG_01540 [Nematocida parisii ERTm1]
MSVELSALYGTSSVTVSAYNEHTGELFQSTGRHIKKIKIRAGTSSVLKLKTERDIKMLSVEDNLLLVLDISSRVYLYNLEYNTEIGRMSHKACRAVCLVNGQVYLEYLGYLQIWNRAVTGIFSFQKYKHITGHQDNICMIVPGDKVLTGSEDGVLRVYTPGEDTSVLILRNKAVPLCARIINSVVYCVWSSGEISKSTLLGGKWTVTDRVYTLHNLIGASISVYGDMVVLLDTQRNIILQSTSDNKPVQKITSTGTHSVQFIESDEWVLLSGDGSAVWEWKTNSLLFNATGSADQRVCVPYDNLLVSGSGTGDVFLWERGSSLCTKKVSEHTACVVSVLPLDKKFLTVSSIGTCTLHSPSGDVLKCITTDKATSMADADNEVLALCGLTYLDVYDIQRSKLIQSYEIDLPLAVKVLNASVVVVTMYSISVYKDTVYTVDTPEQILFADITRSGSVCRISCLGESGMLYEYVDTEEVQEYRVIPGYVNGLGKCTPLCIKNTPEGIIISYKVLVRDREVLKVSEYISGQEVLKWTVLDKAGTSSGRICLLNEPDWSVGICTDEGILLFREGGVSVAWSADTPQDVSHKISQGDSLSGIIGAARLSDTHLMRYALCSGDPIVLAKYVPSDLVMKCVPVVLNALSQGLIERGLLFLHGVMQREDIPGVKQKVSVILSRTINTAHDTTGYTDALIQFRYLSQKTPEVQE